MSNQAARPAAWSVRHVSGKYGFVTLDMGEAVKWASTRSGVSIHALGPIAPAIKLHLNVSNVKVTLNADGSYSIDPGEQPAPAPINYGALDPVQRLAVCRGEQVAPESNGTDPISALLGLLKSKIDVDAKGFIELSGIHIDNFNRALLAAGASVDLDSCVEATRFVKNKAKPVAVVLPSRDRITLSAPLKIPAGYTLDGNCEYELQIWRACIDEVTRLNGAKP